VYYTVWPGTVLGIGLHHLTDQILLLKKEGESNKLLLTYAKDKMFSSNYDQIYEMVVNQYKKANRKCIFKNPRNSTRGKQLENGDKIVAIYIEHLLNKYFSDDNIETFYTEKFVCIQNVEGSPFNVSGTVDLILIYKDGTILVVDHKTTKYADKFDKNEEGMQEDFQSMMYTYLAKHEYNLQSEKFVYEVVNVKTGETQSIFYPGFRGIRSIISQIASIVSQVNSADVEKSYTPSKKACEWCDFKVKCKRSYYGDRNKQE